MSDSDLKTALRRARDELGYSREMVVRRPELDPPITTKTLERWEADPSKVKPFRFAQLAKIYRLRVTDLRNGQVAA